MVSKIRLAIEIIILISALMIFINLIFLQNYLNNNNNNSSNKEISLTANIILNTLEKENYSKNNKFYWDHMPLTYSFLNLKNKNNSNCSNSQILRIKKAFKIIENSTKEKVRFKENIKFENEDIKIYCRGVKFDSINYLDEGKTKYNVRNNQIRYGEINFYNHLNCGDWPDTEIHEILHLFGYEHINNPQSIMNPESEICDLNKIDDWIIKDLVENYD